MDCCIIGTGYVGLVTGACLADMGHSVTCVDRDAAKVAALVRGEVPIYEAELEAVVRRNLDSGGLLFTGDIRSAVAGAEATPTSPTWTRSPARSRPPSTATR